MMTKKSDMSPDEYKEYKHLADLIKSGKDTWIMVYVDNHAVTTTTIFVNRFGCMLEEWVRDYLKTQPKMHDFGTNVEIDPKELWQLPFDGDTICQLSMRTPDGEPCICIETERRLREKAVLKTQCLEGQNRTKL